jgi:zinc finger SWIM domain-containing protein 3
LLLLVHWSPTMKLKLEVDARGSRDEIIGAWLDHNTVRQKGVKVITSNKNRIYRSCCQSVPGRVFAKVAGVCQAHLFTRPCRDADSSEWEIYGYNGVHSCDEKDAIRKRNYKTAHLELASAALKDFVPNKRSQGGAAKQVVDIAKRNGIDVRKSHANKIVSSKRNDSVEVHIGQYWLLESYFQLLREADPQGTFKLKKQSVDWDSRPAFLRCYAAHSFQKHIWREGCMKIITVDGTFTKHGYFEQTILIAVAKDGNNQLVLLAYAVCNTENEDNWVWFMDFLKGDFPGIEILCADYDKGIQSDRFQSILSSLNALFRRCVKHMAANASKAVLKRAKLTENEAQLVMKVCRARTRAIYQTRLGWLQLVSTDVATWFDTQKDQFASYRFLDRSKQGFAIITNNAAEQLNSVIVEQRSDPILDMLIGIRDWMTDAAVKRKETALKWRQDSQVLTEYAEKERLKTMEEAAKRIVRVTFRSEAGVSAEVSHTVAGGATSTLAVEINLVDWSVKCPCRYIEETGRLCYHGCAVIRRESLNPSSPQWFHEVYHQSTYERAYDVPNIPSITILGRLESHPLLPPKSKKPAGRPKTNRYEHSDKPRECPACGKPGHFDKNCKEPKTELRFKRYEKDAMKRVEQELAKAATSIE